jgi:hypothetical protein
LFGVDDWNSRRWWESGISRTLKHIVIPIAVKKIKEWAFKGCSGLTAVALGEGGEEIGEETFAWTALKSIKIPLAVKAMHGSAFYAWSNLESVVFSQVIEEFVTCKACARRTLCV